METYFETQMRNCVNEFYELYNENNYISKKRFDDFIDKYNDVFQLVSKMSLENDYVDKIYKIAHHGYEMINIKNDKYVSKNLESERNYFDNMFISIDKNISLDEEQRKAILIDEDYSLVVAGAGSGKTTTMAAKVKYLIEKKKIKPNNIIVISFTNKATEEMNNILNDKFHLNVDVSTFHKLGMKFIRNIFNERLEIVGDRGMHAILNDFFINEIFPNKQKLKEYTEHFSELLRLNDKCFDYENYDDYYKYYTDLRYNMCKDNLHSEIKWRINNRERNLKTINGEYVASLGELQIANYLYKNNIHYLYEERYPFDLANGRIYKPDFTIDNIGDRIYLEYYGLATLNIDGTISSYESEYVTNISIKRATHSKNKTDYIELFGKYENNDYFLPKLSYYLNKRNVIKTKRTDKEIFYRLMETSKNSPYLKLIKFFITFISLFKELNYKQKDFEILKKQTNNIEIIKQLELLEEVFQYYQNRLYLDKKIDFSDMIYFANMKMEELKKNNKQIKYDYIIIDEYQDISTQRHSFAKKISDLFNAKIIAVGDDWQTIYSFSGSDIELFTKFYDIMGYAEIIKLTKTYRNSQELIDIAGNFILKNSFQIDKKLQSNKTLENPVELIKYKINQYMDDLPVKLDKLINKIHQYNKKHTILLLARFNTELDNLINSKLFYKPFKGSSKIICKSCPDAIIDFLTIHKSKGLGYDQVILLNAIDGIKGFPSKIKDLPIIKFIKGNTLALENIEFPEERRLFYVAMTRTKNKLYIMIPDLHEFKSEFIKEIENEENVTCTEI